MTLQELIDRLSALDPTTIAPKGFHNPHSWRGIYAELAFEPTDGPVTVGEMLASAKSAVGKTYEGWKGGEYTMGLHTDVHIDREGRSGYSSFAELWFATLSTVTAKPPVLTEREQKAIDNINAVLNDDGSDPDYNPGGAWDDCGEVDVPILLALVARLTK